MKKTYFLLFILLLILPVPVLANESKNIYKTNIDLSFGLRKDNLDWSIAGDIMHSAIAKQDTIVVEVFSPVREEYLPYYTNENVKDLGQENG